MKSDGIVTESVGAAGRSRPGRPETRPIVLVVDDDPALRFLARKSLERAGAAVLEARDGREALEAFDAAQPALVLLDVNMPDMSGYEVCATLRRRPEAALTPIFMMTAGEDAATIDRAYQVGASDFVTKPINWTLLGYRVRRALRDTARVLLEAGRAVGSTLEVAEVLRRLTREVVRALGADTGAAWLITPGQTSFAPVAGYRTSLEHFRTFQQLPYPSTSALVEFARSLREPIQSSDSPTDPRLSHPVFGLVPHKSLLVLPLRHEDAVIGAIAVAWTRCRHEITSWEVQLAEAIARHAEMAVNNARLHTEILTRDEQLRQSQKLEAVGRLAGGIAHDFNNLLAVVMGHAHLLLAAPRLTDAHRRRIEAITEASNRAAALTHRLLAFSRKEMPEPQLVDLNQVAEGTTRLLERVIGEDVKLVFHADPALGLVKADPGQLEQLIMNLAINARDAMPLGGSLTLETANVEVAAGGIYRSPTVRPGRFVLLTVKDTGVGMDERTQEHLFEPFFTTKEPGKGTGLGLATAHGIVTQAGGFIGVHSLVGRGSTFEVYLPRVDGEADAPSGPSTGAKSAPRAAETILLVDDEPAVLEMLEDMLKSYGYRVLTASHGAGALEILRASAEPIHLLLADIVMPKLDGAELARLARGARPELRVLYMSGYTEHGTLARALAERNAGFIAKPFMRQDLGCKVREVLDGAAPQGGSRREAP